MNQTQPLQARLTRTYEYAPASFDLEAAMSMSGLDYLRALAAGTVGARPSIADTLNMSVPLEIEEGRIAFEAEPADYMLNPLGTVHGGFAATLLDSALGTAVQSALPAGSTYSTTDLKVSFVRPLKPDSGRLRAEGEVIHIGRTMATSQARLVGIDSGKLFAHGTATCAIFQVRQP